MVDLDAEFERACGEPHEGAAFDALSRRDKILIAIWGLEAEVNNGGFDQYYFNGAGDLAFFAPQALEQIGARNMAAIVREANERFGVNGPARDRETRQEQLTRLTASNEDLFDSLDRRFQDYPDDISAVLTVFLDGADDREST
ncbi:MAG: DMP19 family protein [Sandaracinaceae bacterium]